MVDLNKVDPIQTTSELMDTDGTPKPFFIRQWNLIRQFVNAAGGSIAGLTAQVALNTANILTLFNRNINTTAPLAGGGNLTADRTLSLNDTAVTPAVYGDTTHVAQVTVDQKGRITAAANVAITYPGGGNTNQGAMANRVTNQAISSATDTLVQFVNEVYDDATFIDLGTANTKISIPVGYNRAILTVFVQFDGATSLKAGAIKKNGSFSYDGTTGYLATTDRFTITTGVMAVVGGTDYFEVNVNTTGARNVAAAYFSILAWNHT